jgi:hypothetical protein
MFHRIPIIDNIEISDSAGMYLSLFPGLFDTSRTAFWPIPVMDIERQVRNYVVILLRVREGATVLAHRIALFVRLPRRILTGSDGIELGLVGQYVVRLLSNHLYVHSTVQMIDAFCFFGEALLVLNLMVAVPPKQRVEDTFLAFHLASCQFHRRSTQKAFI